MYATPTLQQALRAGHTLVLSLVVGAVVVACGGGVGSTGTGEVATSGSYSSGTVSGFGSVIVNGVRFDTSAAQVVDEDEGSTSSGDGVITLGMEVEVTADTPTPASDGSLPSAHASRIAYGSALLGVIDAGSINASAGTLSVLGQNVTVTDATVFGTGLPGGLAALHDGDVINVHGLLDQGISGVTTASRIDLVSGSVSYYRLRGVISQLDTVAETFKFGSQLISYAAIRGEVGTLVDGQVMRVKVQTTQVNGAWQAVRIKTAEHRLAEHDRQQAEIEGVINAFTSVASFEVNGQRVDASGTVVYTSNGSAGGSASDLAAGVRVEVEGTVRDGVLVASSIDLRKPTSDRQRQFEFHGRLSALDTTQKTFELRGSVIEYGTATFSGGASEAALANDLKVEIKGIRSTDGTRIVATRIKFED